MKKNYVIILILFLFRCETKIEDRTIVIEKKAESELICYYKKEQYIIESSSPVNYILNGVDFKNKKSFLIPANADFTMIGNKIKINKLNSYAILDSTETANFDINKYLTDYSY